MSPSLGFLKRDPNLESYPSVVLLQGVTKQLFRVFRIVGQFLSNFEGFVLLRLALVAVQLNREVRCIV